jgi:hypothetical protein
MSFTSAQVEAQGTDSAWIIKGGSYAGQSVPIDKSLATRKGSRFWRVSAIRGDRRIVGWNPSTLPAKVAFHSARITEADSAAFWSILQRMEEDMGMHLFEPTSLAREDDDEKIIVVDLKPMAGDEGVTYITWSTNSAPYDARVYLRDVSSMHNPRVVTHELMHALGFGHTSSWTSVMNGGGAGPDRLTPEDVAYAQAAFESRAANEREDLWARLALAMSREDKPVAPALSCPDSMISAIDVIESGGSVPAAPPIGGLPRSSRCFR